MSPELSVTLMGPVENSPKGRGYQTFSVFLVPIPDFFRHLYMVISDSAEPIEPTEEELRLINQCMVSSSWLVRHFSSRECVVPASDEDCIPEI